MKFSFYATNLLLLNGLSGSHARMGSRSRSLEEDDALSQLIAAVLGPILEAFPIIEDIPILGDIVGEIYADSLTYDEIVTRVLTDFGYTEIPDPYCNITRDDPENDNSLATLCDSDGKLTVIDIGDNLLGEAKPPSGFISTFIGKLPELIWLWSKTNSDHLNYGSLPTEIGQLTELVFLGFDNTGLTGSVPSEFSSLTNLQILQLAFSPDLTGTIPGGYDDLSSLSIESTGISDFDVAYCDIEPDYEDSQVPEDKC